MNVLRESYIKVNLTNRRKYVNFLSKLYLCLPSCHSLIFFLANSWNSELFLKQRYFYVHVIFMCCHFTLKNQEI